MIFSSRGLAPCRRSKLVLLLTSICLLLFLVNEKFVFESSLDHEPHFFSIINRTSINSRFYVDILSNVSIGEYLWTHILEGKKEILSNNLFATGNTTIEDMCFIYQSGTADIKASSSHVVLVADATTEQKQKETEVRLKKLLALGTLENLFLVISVNHGCNSSWLMPYLDGDQLKAVFMVHSSNAISHYKIHPWPLGVAIHLGFPLFFSEEINILSRRPYMCSLIISSNTTSRLLESNADLVKACRVMTVNSHGTVPNSLDSQESLWQYIEIVSDSDVTFCATSEFAMSETHCIYEALSLGSVPVIDDTLNCGKFDLLVRLNAPIVLVTSFDEVNNFLDRETRLNLQEKIARRATVVNWYSEFRHRMARHFVDVIRSHIN